MRKAFLILSVVFSLCILPDASARVQEGNVLVPISKYITRGNASALSAWFAPDLDISTPAGSSTASRIQAKQIMRAFFREYLPDSFSIDHITEKANMKYVLANLKAGGESFNVIIFLSRRKKSYEIKQLKIDRRQTL